MIAAWTLLLKEQENIFTVLTFSNSWANINRYKESFVEIKCFIIKLMIDIPVSQFQVFFSLGIPSTSAEDAAVAKNLSISFTEVIEKLPNGLEKVINSGQVSIQVWNSCQLMLSL